METDRDRAHLAWRRAERIRKLSDRVIGIGPWGLGLDGVLAWAPVAGTVYSVGAGGILLYEALKADASNATIARMAAYLGLDSVSSGVPIVGWAIDTLFTGHAFAARALQKDIERRHGLPARGEEAQDATDPLKPQPGSSPARWQKDASAHHDSFRARPPPSPGRGRHRLRGPHGSRTGEA